MSHYQIFRKFVTPAFYHHYPCHHHRHWHHHHWQNSPFWAITFLTRSGQTSLFCCDLDHQVFTSLDFVIVIFYLKNQVSVFMSTSDRIDQLRPQILGFLYIAFYDSQDYSGAILTCLHKGRFNTLSPLPMTLKWSLPHMFSGKVLCAFIFSPMKVTYTIHLTTGLQYTKWVIRRYLSVKNLCCFSWLSHGLWRYNCINK
jgi:hypothetical protein